MQQPDKLFELALHLTPKLGGIMIRHLVAHFGSAEKVFEANLKNLLRVQGIGENTARIILQKDGVREAEIELKKLEKSDKKFLQVALCGDAEALLSYDRALLKVKRGLPFPVLKPEVWAATSFV